MNSKLDGGPAFPVVEQSFIHGGGVSQSSGMSLRDWFAGQALQGILSCDAVAVAGLPKFALAQDAWEMAESMLNAKEISFGIQNDELLKLRTELNCRIEHGADGLGHLKFVQSKLDEILKRRDE
jgi:hypothetical protein